MNDGIVDWELSGPDGKKAAQQPQVAQSFAAGESRQLTWTLPAPGAAGTYKLAIGFFGAGWQPMHAWIADAASFSVTVNPKEHYGFEDGTQGWASGGNPIMSQNWAKFITRPVHPLLGGLPLRQVHLPGLNHPRKDARYYRGSPH